MLFCAKIAAQRLYETIKLLETERVRDRLGALGSETTEVQGGRVSRARVGVEVSNERASNRLADAASFTVIAKHLNYVFSQMVFYLPVARDRLRNASFLFLYQSCLVPCRMSTQPKPSMVLIRSTRFTPQPVPRPCEYL